MKILMVASEARPFSKTGGLADVSYALSKELALMGEDVYIITPFYKQIKDKIFNEVERICYFEIGVSWRNKFATIYKKVESGITYLFVDNNDYFYRDHLYGDNDDYEKFAFFTLAAREFMYRTNFAPDIVHVHDWHAGMLPCLMREHEYGKEFFKNTRIVTSIHNPAFQGLMDKFVLGDLYGLPDYLFDNGQVRFKGCVSSLKTAIVYADKVTTVSPNHRHELLTPEGSMGLDGVLRLREWDFCGILNGIDYDEFNPEKDKSIPYPYTTKNFIQNKAKNKKALFEELHINDYGQPLFSLVSRVTWQKGLDVLFPACEELVRRGCNIILLGSGEKRYEDMMNDLQRRYPNNVAVYIGYSDALAHRIYAASDFFLMPSLFEPCGLGQMIAQRYGTLPIVRYTGGLKDSVIGFDGSNEDTANGFGFYDFTVDAMVNTCIWAYDTSANQELLNKLKENAMKTDNSWKRSAEEYLRLYKEIVK